MNLTVNALRVVQQVDVPLFVFGVDGRRIKQFADVEFAERDRAGTLKGYQRQRINTHIKEIFAYLEQEDSILPNAIVVSFGSKVVFKELPGGIISEWGTFGRLTIPLPGTAAEEKPAVIVDGQQRMTALSRLDPQRSFPVVIVGFQSDDPEKLREQFVLVNKTKPLPRDLINELLPALGGDVVLPRSMKAQRFAAMVMELLRFKKGSPFCGRVQGLDPPGGNANISQNAVIQVIKRSVSQGGALSNFNSGDDNTDAANCAKVISVFFTGVREVWPVAWGGSPRNSRLVHGAGIFAMGVLMDEVMEEALKKSSFELNSAAATNYAKRQVFFIKKRCAWTEDEGKWPRLRCEWNDIENTGKDKRRLAEYIVTEWRKAKKRKHPRGRR